MSLRTKALIFVLIIVVGVTQILTHVVLQVAEERAREGVASDLADSVEQLERLFEQQEELVEKVMQGSRSDILNLIHTKVKGPDGKERYLEIKGGFHAYTNNWVRDAGASVSMVAYDAFVAEDRQQNVMNLKSLNDLVVCAFSTRDKSLESLQQSILDSQELCHFVSDFYQDPEAPNSTVLGVGPKVFHVILTMLYEDAGQTVPVGVSIMMVDLDSNWVMENRLDTMRGHSLKQVIYHQDQVAGTSLDDGELSQQIVRQASEGIEGSFEVSAGQRRYIARTHTFSDTVGYVAVRDLDNEMRSFVSLAAEVQQVGWLLAVLGVLIALMLSMTVVRRLRRLEWATLKIKDGDFDTRVEVVGGDEISRLGESLNNMTKGLKALGLYTDKSLALGVLQGQDSASAQGQRVNGTTLFTDIVGFTPIAESLDDRQLVSLLNRYFAGLGEAIRQEEGYLDKFIGDAVMAYWGPPFITSKNFAAHAAWAVLLCRQFVEQFDDECRREGLPTLGTRFGLATGPVTVGNLGSHDKKNFTVIGDCVNLASRLEGANKLYGTEILMDEKTASELPPDFVVREVDRIRVKGKDEVIRVSELLGLKSQVSAEKLAEINVYADALELYRERNFKQAFEKLEGASEGPEQWLKNECEKHINTPPPEDWDAITTATVK